MLKTFLIPLLSILSLLLLFPKDRQQEDVLDSDSQKESIEISGQVEQIINNKCLFCHMPQSENKSAKRKLLWENVPSYRLKDQERFVKKMEKVLSKGKMPPKRYIKEYPTMELSAEEVSVLLEWINKEKQRIEGEG